MKYKAFIEDNFLIDDAKTGQLVPFRFNDVQNDYYQTLCTEYDIENKGITTPIREDILKARREGFTSFILGLFCADDILQKHATNTEVTSYKDDATKTMRNRYKNFVLSYFAKKQGIEITGLKESDVFKKNESGEYILRHNDARFYCGTASARTGGRGGVVHKQLYTECAHYPDTELMTSSEIIEGGMRQVDIDSGWIFKETTANGQGNHHHRSWQLEKQGLSRFRPRFYGWRKFYTEEQFKIIASEFTDKDMLKQEYPETDEEAFMATGKNFTNEEELQRLIDLKNSDKELIYWMELPGVNYIDQCDMLKATLLTLIEANKHYYLYAGIDVAKDEDKTVLTVIRDNRLIVNGGLRGIAIDSTGAGDFMPDWFSKNSRWYIHAVKFSRTTKDVMYKNLQVVIKDVITKLPILRDEAKQFFTEESKNFWKEMLDLTKEIMGYTLVVQHPRGKGYYDDYPDSWALAELVYTVFNGPPKGQQIMKAESHTNETVRRLLSQSSRNSNYNSNYE